MSGQWEESPRGGIICVRVKLAYIEGDPECGCVAMAATERVSLGR